MKKFVLLAFCSLCITIQSFASEPLRLAVAGVTHGHINMVLRNLDRTDDFKLVGIYEENIQYAYELAEKFGVDKNIIYSSLEEMLDKTKPEAVAGFGSIYDHMKIVEAAAPRGIDVMVEKPLAVSVKDAEKMAKLAQEYGINIITNYETTWYESHDKAHKMIEKGDIGDLTKIIVYDGHSGPIHMEPTFVEWLTDPVQNGGGAVIDFGCYGANLVTWLLKGEMPKRVYADIRNHKPDVYTKVDDDATILLSYDDMEAVINGSWSWPFDRKDMHIYGKTGYIFADNKNTIRYRTAADKDNEIREILTTPIASPYDDPFKYLKAVVRGEITPDKYDLSSLENNIIVVKILEAAKKSAQTGKAVNLRK